MKQIYPLATLMLAVLLLSNGAFAQTYTGGSYTAVRNGNWHVTSGLNVWSTSEPPSNCINCLITITSGVSVTLNTHVTLSNSSLLQIGTNGSFATQLSIASSSGTDWASSFNVILVNDGTSPANAIKLVSSSDFVNVTATGAQGTYDGVLTYIPSSNHYYKMVGSSPSGFSGTTMESSSGTPSGSQLIGPKTLSGTGTLPILLSGFTAVLNNKSVDLNWTTMQESNSDHFGILRSTDGGNHWLTIGTVTAKGTSSSPVDYSYTDANPASGVSQYRLQLIDRDGAYKYSDIKVIRDGLINNVKVFPNPAKDYVYITLGSGDEAVGTNFTVRLMNQSGQVLAEKKQSNGNGTTVPLSVSNYPPGTYLVVVNSSDGAQQATKILISK